MTKALFLQQNLRSGEHYAGIILNPAGDYHLIVVPGEAENVTWEQAKAWAESIGAALPTRREQRVLFANAKDQFKPNWYWSGEQHAGGSDYAWNQTFDDGNQYYGYKSFEGRARAVRRIYIDGASPEGEGK